MEEMFEQFKVMLENIEKIPKNNFKRNAEIELTNMIKTTEWKKNERQFNDSMTLSEIEEVREDPSDPNMKEMFEQFRVMLENIQKIPKNNFKRNAEIELTNMIKTTQWKKSDREAFLNCPTFTECCWEKLD